jgi:hypothetical protein
MTTAKDGWPDITYRYVTHYFWEPQHLLRTASSIAAAQASSQKKEDVVYRKLRTQEVPLNYLVNILLRIAPSAVRRTVLRPFGIDITEAGLASLTLKTPQEWKFIQPDVHLESDASRVFIELKVDARLTLSQLNKYARLHRALNVEAGVKRSYVLLLVRQQAIMLSDIKKRFSCADAASVIPSLIEGGSGETVFGATTWDAFGCQLLEELNRRQEEKNEAAEMLFVLINDFLADLDARGLLSKSSVVQLPTPNNQSGSPPRRTATEYGGRS